MSDALFREGGPYKTRRVNQDEYRLTIPIPSDEEGLVGRECPDHLCSPGYFKVKIGTGITEGQEVAYCPYCHHASEPSDFLSKAQKDYAIKLLGNEAIDGINRMVQQSLGLGASGVKRIGAGLMSFEISLKPAHPQLVSRPFEEELRRDVTCPFCGLVHSVFGLATWCPDYGKDIFINHVEAEMTVIRNILGAVETRKIELGARVAARDVENALEDIVSIYETVLKVITKKYLNKIGDPEEIINNKIKKIGNAYQNTLNGKDTFMFYTGFDLFEGMSEDEIQILHLTFEKRHPITHNLGIIDRRYLDKVRSGEIEGREVRVTVEEVNRALDISLGVLKQAYSRI